MKVVFKAIAFILYIIYIFYFNNVYAITDGIVYLSSDKQIIEINEELEIFVNIENFYSDAYDFELFFDNDKLEFINENNNDNVNVIDNRIICLWYDKNGGSNEKTGRIESFKFKVKNSGIETFGINGNFYTKKGQEVRTDFKELELEIGSNETTLQKQAKEEEGNSNDKTNSKLQNLRLSIEGMVPDFNKDIFNYYLTVNDGINNIEVLAISENNNSKITVTGNENLKDGLNIIKIDVTSEDKINNSQYIINVTKTNKIEDANTNLETLAIKDVLLYPSFDNNIINYNVEVSNTTDNITLLAIPEDEEAIIEIKKSDKLQEGNNEIKITVTAKNNYTKKDYIINVYKRNNDEELKYQEEQKENQESLNEILEKTSITIQSNDKQENNKDKQENNKEQNENEMRNSIFYIIGIILIFTIILLINKKLKNKSKKKTINKKTKE